MDDDESVCVDETRRRQSSHVRSAVGRVAGPTRGDRGGDLPCSGRVRAEGPAPHVDSDHEEDGEDGARKPEHTRAGLLERARVFTGTRAAANVSISVAPMLDDAYGLLQQSAGRPHGVPVYRPALQAFVATWAEPSKARDTVKMGSREEAVEGFTAAKCPPPKLDKALQSFFLPPEKHEAPTAELADKWEKELDSFPRQIWYDVLRVFSAMSNLALLNAYLKGVCEGDTGTGEESDGQRLDECFHLAREMGEFVKAALVPLGAIQATTVLNRRAIWLPKGKFADPVNRRLMGNKIETTGLFGVSKEILEGMRSDAVEKEIITRSLRPAQEGSTAPPSSTTKPAYTSRAAAKRNRGRQRGTPASPGRQRARLSTPEPAAKPAASSYARASSPGPRASSEAPPAKKKYEPAQRHSARRT